MQIKLISVLYSVLLSIKCMCYFNPSASPVVFNPLLFSRGVIFTFFAMVFSIRLASNAIFLSVQVISWKVKSTRRYLSLFPTSKKLSQSIWMFLMVMLLHWHCSYIYILVLFICNLRQTRNFLCFRVTKSS